MRPDRAADRRADGCEPAINMEYLIDQMQPNDWEQVRAIYLEGIATGLATFETEAPSWEKWDAAHLPTCRLVARRGETVLAWAALSPVSSRRVYAGVAEVSIYVGTNHRGQGLGQKLLEALIAASEQHGIWTLQAGIFADNRASLALHQRSGFREVGRRERIGRLPGTWRDVALLERRSKTVGLD
jgi:L-amino acid N-acyltransferase YncA